MSALGDVRANPLNVTFEIWSKSIDQLKLNTRLHESPIISTADIVTQNTAICNKSKIRT